MIQLRHPTIHEFEALKENTQAHTKRLRWYNRFFYRIFTWCPGCQRTSRWPVVIVALLRERRVHTTKQCRHCRLTIGDLDGTLVLYVKVRGDDPNFDFTTGVA